METGSQIDSYTGTAALGLGSTNAIPVSSPGVATNIADKTADNLMLMNHENNLNIWHQKMADRDTMNKMLADGEIASGKILDDDRKNQYDPALKAVDDSYYAMIKAGGLSNPEAVEEYRNKVEALQNVVDQAGARYLGRNAIETEKRTKTLPSDIKDYDDYLSKADKESFWQGQYLPHQQSLTMNFDWVNGAKDGAIIGGPQATTATADKVSTTTKGGAVSTTDVKTTAPVKGGAAQPVSNIVYKGGLPYSRTTSEISFNKINQNTNQGYISDRETAAQYDKFISSIEKPDSSLGRAKYQAIFKPLLQHIIDKASQYNTDRGLKQGDQDYIDVQRVQKSITQDPQTGVYKIGLPTPEFAALYTLSTMDGYKTNTDVFMKDEAKALTDKAKEWLGERKFNLAKDQLTKDQKVGNQIYQNLSNQINTGIPSSTPGTKEGINGYVNVDDLPASRQFIAGVVYNDKGVATVGRVYPKYTIKNNDGSVNNETTDIGTKNNPQVVPKYGYGAYNSAKTSAESTTKANVTFPSYPEWVKQQASDDGHTVESRYDVSYTNDKGNKINALSDLSIKDQNRYNNLKKQGYKLSFNDFLKGLVKTDPNDVQAQFEGEDGGVGNVNSIIESQEFEQDKYGKKGFSALFGDNSGGDNSEKTTESGGSGDTNQQ